MFRRGGPGDIGGCLLRLYIWTLSEHVQLQEVRVGQADPVLWTRRLYMGWCHSVPL